MYVPTYDDLKSPTEMNHSHTERTNYAIGKNITINIQVRRTSSTSPRKVTVKEVEPETWKKAKIKVRKLRDENTSSNEKCAIADDLTSLLDEMEKKLILEARSCEPGDEVVCTVEKHDEKEVGQISSKRGEALAPPPTGLADVGHQLANLEDSISFVKNEILFSRDRERSEIVDVHVCRGIHRNFRRILQKESRFLRDELRTANEKIGRLEKKSSNDSFSSTNISSHSNQLYRQNTKITTFNDFRSHPTNFINVVEPVTLLRICNPIPCPIYSDSIENFGRRHDFRRLIPNDELYADAATKNSTDAYTCYSQSLFRLESEGSI